jgi:hypothetical protein
MSLASGVPVKSRFSNSTIVKPLGDHSPQSSSQKGEYGVAHGAEGIEIYGSGQEATPTECRGWGRRDRLRHGNWGGIWADYGTSIDRRIDRGRNAVAQGRDGNRYGQDEAHQEPDADSLNEDRSSFFGVDSGTSHRASIHNPLSLESWRHPWERSTGSSPVRGSGVESVIVLRIVAHPGESSSTVYAACLVAIATLIGLTQS